MAKEDLESKAARAVLNIAKSMPIVVKKVTNMDNVLRDLSMKLCYLIKHKGLGGNYYTLPAGIEYDRELEDYE